MVSSSLSNKASQLFSPVEQKESEKDYSKIHNLHLKQTVHKDFVKYLQLKYCLLPNLDPRAVMLNGLSALSDPSHISN